jgi:hypothetical protein
LAVRLEREPKLDWVLKLQLRLELILELKLVFSGLCKKLLTPPPNLEPISELVVKLLINGGLELISL